MADTDTLAQRCLTHVGWYLSTDMASLNHFHFLSSIIDFYVAFVVSNVRVCVSVSCCCCDNDHFLFILFQTKSNAMKGNQRKKWRKSSIVLVTEPPPSSSQPGNSDAPKKEKNNNSEANIYEDIPQKTHPPKFENVSLPPKPEINYIDTKIPLKIPRAMQKQGFSNTILPLGDKNANKQDESIKKEPEVDATIPIRPKRTLEKENNGL